MGAFGIISLVATATVGPPESTILILGERGQREDGEDRTASATTIDLEDRPSAHESLADVLVETPGARVCRSGGDGAFAGLALRGHDMAHTNVLLGELPVGGADDAVVDLGMLPVSLFTRVEVYRGGAPTWLGDGSIGGVLRLVPKDGDSSIVTAEVGAGSFATYWGGAEARIAHTGGGTFLRAGFERSLGDFTYLDDGGTRFFDADDTERRRTNAQFATAHGLAHTEIDTSLGRWSTVLMGVHRDGGEPGAAAAPSRSAKRSQALVLGATALTHHGTVGSRAYRVQARVGSTYGAAHFLDPKGEIGPSPTEAEDRDLGLHGRVAASFDVLSWLESTLILANRYDLHSTDDRLRAQDPLPSSRFGLTVGAEMRLHDRVFGRPFELRPSFRAEWTKASLATEIAGPAAFGAADLPDGDESAVADGSLGGQGAASSSESPPSGREPTMPSKLSASHFAPTIRLGASLDVVDWLTAFASASTGRRFPSTLELFGNRSALVGNRALRQERSSAADVGVEAHHSIAFVRLRLETRAFGAMVEDLIRYRRTSQFTAVPENVARSRIMGVEAGGQIRLGRHAELASNATMLVTRDDLDRELPLRPRLSLLFRPSVRSGVVVSGLLDDIVGFTTIERSSQNFVDPANLIVIPARTWIGAGLRLELLDARASIALTMNDLLDARGFDVLGFPLPGQRFDLSVAYTETF